MKKIVCLMMALSLFMAGQAMAGTSAGDKELGIMASWQYMDPDEGDGGSVVLSNASLNWFFTDALSLGVALTGYWFLPDEGDDMVASGLYLEPNYHFATASSFVPYIGAHTGMFNIQGEDLDETYFSYGVQGGVKAFISEDVALKVEGRYTEQDEYATYGIMAGLSIFF